MEDRFRYKARLKTLPIPLITEKNNKKYLNKIYHVMTLRNLHIDKGCQIVELYGLSDIWISIECVDLIQCTGQTDKKSDLIYTGDIFEFMGKGKYEVVFENAAFFLKPIKGGRASIYFKDLISENISPAIGNIYENPELLNEK